MHIHKFANLAVFDEVGIGGTLPATAEYREFIKKLHPAQVLTGRLTVPLLEVRCSYVTKRGNYRTAKKYLIRRPGRFYVEPDCEKADPAGQDSQVLL